MCADLLYLTVHCQLSVLIFVQVGYPSSLPDNSIEALEADQVGF